MRVGSQKQLAITYCRRGIEHAVVRCKSILFQDFQLGFAVQYKKTAVASLHKQLAVDRDRRSVDGTSAGLDARNTLLVNRFTGLC